MRSQKPAEWTQGYLILASLIVIVASVLILSVFLLTTPPKARDVLLEKELQNKIVELPSEKVLKQTLAA
jgi:hypothetical protein